MGHISSVKGSGYSLTQMDKTLLVAPGSAPIGRGCIVRMTEDGMFVLASNADTAPAGSLYISLQDHDDAQSGMAGTVQYDAEYDGVRPGSPSITGLAVTATAEYETDQFIGLQNAPMGTPLMVGANGRLVAADGVGTVVGHLTAAPEYTWYNDEPAAPKGATKHWARRQGASVKVIRFKTVGAGAASGGGGGGGGGGGQAVIALSDPAMKYGYYYWSRNVKGESVDKDTMSYSMLPDRYVEFVAWYLGNTNGVSSVVEEQMDNFAVWYRYYAGGAYESMGALFQEYAGWVEENGLVDTSRRSSRRDSSLHPVDIRLPGGTNFWVYDEDKDVFAHWYNEETHVTRIPSSLMADFSSWYAANYSNDAYIDRAEYTPTTATVTNMSDGAIYGGTYTDGRRLSNTASGAHLGITLRNLSLSGCTSSAFISKPSDETQYPDNLVDLTVEGDNQISSTGRCLTISSESYNTIRGRYDVINDFKTPTLTLTSTSSTQCGLKGLFYISDVVLDVTTITPPEDGELDVISDGQATMVFNGGAVSTYQSAGGKAYIDLGDCQAGVRVITTRSDPDVGYVLAGYLVNGDMYEGELDEDANVTFPPAGVTISITPVFELSQSAKVDSFAVLSDIHLRENNMSGGLDDFSRAIRMMESNGVTDCYISGDIGYEHLNAERELFKSYVQDSSISFKACTGNHDTNVSDEEWIDDIGNPKDYTFTKNGVVYVFMSLKQSTSTQNTTEPYSESTLTWFEGILSANTDKPVVVFTHFPLTNASTVASEKFAGIGGYTTYGFSSVEPQNNRILADIKSHGHVVYVTGHTHFAFDVEASVPTVNVSGFDDAPFVHLVHVPSLNLPRDVSGAKINDSNAKAQPNEGWIVDVYRDTMVFKGWDFSYRSPYQLRGTFLPDYMYELPLGFSRGMTITDPFHGNAYTGNTYTVKVSLYGGVESATLTATGGVTLSRYSVSASDGYNVPVIVTVPETADGLCTITLSASGVYSKVLEFYAVEEVQGTVDIGTLTASITPAADAIYYGTNSSTAVKFSHGTSGGTQAAGSVSFGIKDMALAGPNTALYFPYANWEYTMHVYGSNSMRCTVNNHRMLSAYGHLLVIGHGGASITGGNAAGATSIPLKGNLTFRNVRITVATDNAAVHESYGAETDRDLVLEGNATLTVSYQNVSNMAVSLQTESEHGYVGILCGHMDGSPLAVDTSGLDAGCTVLYYINGSESPVSEFPSDLCPSTGSTVMIRAVVSQT